MSKKPSNTKPAKKTATKKADRTFSPDGNLTPFFPASIAASLRDIFTQKPIKTILTKETFEDYPLVARVQKMTIEQLALTKLVLRVNDDSRPDTQLRAVQEVLCRIHGEAPKKIEHSGKLGFHVMYDDQVAELVKGGE
jgi:hypothetical protein